MKGRYSSNASRGAVTLPAAGSALCTECSRPGTARSRTWLVKYSTSREEPQVSGTITHQAGAIRASDGERDQVVAQLQRDFADGRLTQDELEERVAAALAARTRDQLRALTADLPGTDIRAARPAAALDRRVLCLLLCLCPPAGLGYWLLVHRGIGGRWLSRRQLAGIPNWAWILIIAATVSVAAHR